jgi:two-component system, NarL family, nitrate/nitrite response regulator NarL
LSTNDNGNTQSVALRILLIDDHPLFLEGMAAVLRRFDFGVEVDTATSAENGMRAARASTHDLVLLDLALPGMDGFTAIQAFHQHFPSLPVVVLSATERPEDMCHAIELGALGFIPKSSVTAQLFDALRQVLDGNIYVPVPASTVGGHVSEGSTVPETRGPGALSLRQMEVLARLCQGLSNKQTARELELSEKTVKAHVTSIFRALGVVNRTQAVLAAKTLGMFSK